MPPAPTPDPAPVAGTPSADRAAFVAALPKAELHVHHVGSAAPHTVAALAARHPDSPVPKDPGALAEYFTFRDFAHFVEVYISVVDLIRDPEDVRLLTYEVGRDLADRNVRYAELTVTPVTSTRRGIAPEAFMEAIEDARVAVERDRGIVLRWCFDIPGELGLPAAEETTRMACELRPEGLVSFGLGGPELGVGRARFKPFFDRAIAEGLHSVPHAGESSDATSVREAVDALRAERIGHGIRAVEDPALMEELAERGIPLEICPTSNVATRSVSSLAEHPLPAIVAAGVPFSINSDDPPMFGTDIDREYLIAGELLGLDESGLAELARSAVRQSFIDPAGGARLLAGIDAHLAGWGR
ncbi:adenosine deaminase [Streptomyces sp. ST2-7A]|uniref:adenosine deaminase n=1 Tax=Streptomyces sp. ST2-7A TaxID=2907214 RepID=UPI0035ABD79E